MVGYSFTKRDARIFELMRNTNLFYMDGKTKKKKKQEKSMKGGNLSPCL